ncbi:MAG: hypothetical protein WAU01_09320 [Saprospiraceae bacterium]
MHHYIKNIFLAVVTSLLVLSCSNEFELTQAGQDIPVVYGMISVGDTATYIRVEKAFVDENTSAYVLSKDPGQLYFSDINVKLRHVKTNKDFTLTRVDGNLEGYKRDEGAFADAPNYLYKIKKSALTFIPKDEYKLIISKTDGAVLTEATTTALLPYANEDIVSPGASALLSFVNNLDYKFRWFGDEKSVIHDVVMTIFYTEEKAGTVLRKSITWPIARNIDKTEYTIKGRAFFDFMAGALDKDPNIKRFFQSASFAVISGGQEVKEYISIGQANLGITSSGEIPVYTNLSNDARGLFSSRTAFERINIGLAQGTLDSLKNGSITRSLNFK